MGYLYLLGMNTATKVLTETIATWNLLDIAIRLVTGIIGCV
tara:strand:+ start:4955 stop:5077 length:123 start_codon:yes stop_codon:yes gene_type:complete